MTASLAPKIDAALGRLLENARDPGVGVLHVEDRIIARLSLGKLQIEIEMAVRLAHEKKESRRIPPDFFDHFFQRDELAGALAHAHRLAAAGKLNHLHQHDVKRVRIEAQPLHGRFQTRHVAVMISAPDIDQLGEFPLILVTMISNIGREISQLAVAFNDCAIFVVAEGRRLVPLGAILRIEQAVVAARDPLIRRLRAAPASPFR